MLKNRNRLIAAASVAAAASAIVAASIPASASQQISHPVTLRLIARGGSFTPVNVTHATVFPKVGDELIVSHRSTKPRIPPGSLATPS